jgi:hypothetical protein
MIFLYCWTAFALQRVSATQHTHSLCLFPFTSLSYRHISGSKWLGRRPRLRWRRTTSRQRRPGLPTRHGGQGSRAQRERNVMASPLRLFRCEEWQEAAQSQLQPANAHGSKRRRTRKRMRPMAAAAMANMQHAPITCCSQVEITRSVWHDRVQLTPRLNTAVSGPGPRSSQGCGLLSLI